MNEKYSMITSAQMIADGRCAVGRDPSISALSDLCSAAHASGDAQTWTAQHLLACERIVRQHIQSQAARIEELELRLDKAHSAPIKGAALLRQRTFQDDDPNDESLRLLAIELRGVAESLDLITGLRPRPKDDYNLARIESNGDT